VDIKTEELKKEEVKIEPDNGKIKTESPSTDFKIAEIWIREGQLMLDATPEFWRDKFRARGIIAYLDDIVRDAKIPSDKPKILPARGSFLNGIRGLWRGKK
jgi:hypothetical protein